MHKNGILPCSTCTLKLEQADSRLEGWFWNMKLKYPQLHVAWSYRNESDQHAAFLSGKSRQDYPTSKHNHTVSGQPCSLALDVFILDDQGQAHFNPDFYEELNQASLDAGYALRWGGSFVTLKDFDHWEIKES
jgi:hypothetical protein